MKKSFVFIICCLFISSAAIAAPDTLNVPGQFSAIQEAVDNASPGDTVIVNTGTWYEQIDFKGKAITVASRYILEPDSYYIDNTILDGSTLNTDTGSVVLFRSGEDSTSIICGFTIRHGKGTYYTINSETFRGGGGILVWASGAKIIHNHITENHFNDTLPDSPMYLDGAGIAMAGDSPDWVVVAHNNIDGNSTYAVMGNAARTAGLGAFDHNCIIRNNNISYNSCTAENNSTALAGGFAAYSPLMYNYTVIVKKNILTQNSAVSYGSANCWAVWGCGGFQNVTGIFTENLVEDNFCDNPNLTYVAGSGILHLYNPGENSIVKENLFSGNYTDQLGGAVSLQIEHAEPDRNPVSVEGNYFLDNTAYFGGAIYDQDVPAVIQNNVFFGNTATQYGGAVHFRKGFSSNIHHIITMMNNTSSGNSAKSGGSIYTYGNVKSLLINSICWGDTSSLSPGQDVYLATASDTIEIANSDVNTGTISGNLINGGGNIFTDPDFKLLSILAIKESSPCFNTGTAEFTCACGQKHPAPLKDITGHDRPWSTAFDMGAYEFHFPDGIGTNDGDLNALKISTFPNPFNKHVVFRYSSEKNSPVKVTIFNDQGRKVSEFSGERGELIWNSNDLPSGMYYFRGEADGKTGSGKIIKR